MAQKPHVAIFPSPGMGHLIPLAELAKKLALSYDLSSTFIVPSIGPPPEAQTKSLVASTRLVALVLDLFGTDVIDIAMEFSVPSYIASLSTGCATPVHGRDLPDPIQDRKDDAYKWFLHHSSRHGLAEGILLNSFVDLEPETIKGFAGSRTCAGLKVALRPEVDGNGLVGREEIAKVVKGLMQGGEGVAIRNRMKGLKEAAAKAVSEEGSSTKSLHELVSRWKN
ncbi:hypothetical protein OIU78_015593 [Salix suchowensis]|nr:hypothetical protein OIU78_015593 [Salix suchowensis]